MAATKYDERAQNLIRERIAAGDTGNEIRSALAAAGYPADISDAGLSHYRKDPQLRKMIEEAQRTAWVGGFRERSQRVEMLNGLLMEYMKRFHGQTGPNSAARHVSTEVLIALVPQILAIEKRLDALTEPSSSPSSPALSGAQVGFTIGMFADMLESALKEVVEEKYEEKKAA